MKTYNALSAIAVTVGIAVAGSANAESIRLDQLESGLQSSASDQVRVIGPRVYQVSYPNGRVATYWFGADGAKWMLSNRSAHLELRDVLAKQVASAPQAKATIIRSACSAWTLTMDGGIVYSLPGYHYARAITKLERPSPDFGSVPNFSLITYSYAALGTQAPPNGSEVQLHSYGTAWDGPNPLTSQVDATCPSPGACGTNWVTTHAYSIVGCENGGIEWQGSN